MTTGKDRTMVLALWIAIAVFGVAQAAPAGKMSVSPPLPQRVPTPPGFELEPTTAFEQFLQTDIPPADGFDFPVGDPDGSGSYHDLQTNEVHRGWYVYIRFGQRYTYGIHPGEDWNGSGQGNSDEGQPVHAVARGQVVVAEDCIKPTGGVVIIQHVFYENHLKRRVRSVYKHLAAIRVKPGQVVDRRQVIGEVGRDPQKRFVAHLHLEMRWNETLSPTYWPSANRKSLDWIRDNYAEPSAFIRAHRQLFVPQEEEHLVLINPSSYRLRLYERGLIAAEYPLGYGHLRGQQADRRHATGQPAPKGMYFVVERHRRLSGGDFGPGADATRLRLNYPNKYDAARGRELGLVAPVQEARIGREWQRRRPTVQDTLLNRGIGFAGWLQEFDASLPRQRFWGSLLLHPKDMEAAFDRIPVGSMVVIF